MAKEIVGERIILKLATEGVGWGSRIQQLFWTWAAAGMDENAILDKFNAEMSPGGATFESIMNGFRNVTGEAVDYVSIEQVHSEWTGPDKWMWVSHNDANRCVDCKDRNGEIKTWAEWENLGLPGLGATRCGWRCRCSLEPQQYAEEIQAKANF